MYMQNAFKVDENILIFANLQMKKKKQQTKKKLNKQNKTPRSSYRIKIK